MKLTALKTSDDKYRVYWKHNGDYGWINQRGASTETQAYKNAIEALIKRLNRIRKAAIYD